MSEIISLKFEYEINYKKSFYPYWTCWFDCNSENSLDYKFDYD